jgi:hypothetical protein
MGWVPLSDYNEMRERELEGISRSPCHSLPCERSSVDMKQKEEEGRARVIDFISRFGKENRIVGDSSTLRRLSTVIKSNGTFMKELENGLSVYGKWHRTEYDCFICSVTYYNIYGKRRKWTPKLVESETIF